ncbi:MAG: DUF5060 domain-containing protein [Planctomycetota bacterium]
MFVARHLRLFFFFLIFSTPGIHPLFSQSTATVKQASELRQWELMEIHIQSESVQQNPFEIDLSAEISSEAGFKLAVPGYFDGGKNFVIRFTPPSPGEYRFETKCEAVRELNGSIGSFRVLPAEANRRGEIKVDSKDQRRFKFQNGETYFPIAFEADWLFALDCENSRGIPKTRMLVDSLAANGFNQVVMNVFAYDVNWAKDKSLDPKYDYGSPNAFPFLGTNEAPDFGSLNVEYFQRLDRVIKYLDERGIVAHLMIYVWNKRVSWPESESAADNRYFDYVARRYQAFPNLVWDISKEALGYGHTDVGYITRRIQRLREIDVFDRLITVHDYGYCRRFPAQVDFVSVQLWSSELFAVMRSVINAIPGKPILNIEHGGYERGPYVVFNGNYTSAETCLERAYQCVFAGTYPTHYWQGAAWNVVIPDLNELPPNDRPQLQYYRHLNDLVHRYGLDEMKAGDKKSNAGFCLHNGKELVVYYVPRECEYFGLRPPRDQGDLMKLTWFDPFSGEFSEPIELAMTKWPAVKVPDGDQFRILILSIE